MLTHSRRTLLAASMSLVTAASAAAAQAAENVPEDLTEISLSELMNIEISSVSKRLEPLSDAAAAVYVITKDQLMASGARNLAEALRQVPGVQVARTDARSYAVSVRGFNSSSSDKLEVRLDGRSVYTPLFSGVFWDVFEVAMDAVERIEIIRGPGATLYGANAVNGVINVITKSVDAGGGGNLRLAAGNEELATATATQSFKLGAGGLRLSAIGKWRDNSATPSGDEAADAARFSQVRTRSDGQAMLGGKLSTFTTVYDARFAGSAGDTKASGQVAQARWVLPTPTGERSLQLAYDHTERNIPNIFVERRNTARVDFEEQRSFGAQHQLVYGLGALYTADATGGPPNILIFAPESRTLNTFSAFVQDQVALSPSTTLTLGSKFEHNDVSGFEAQPSIRLGWRASPASFLWGSVSRAVRTPNRLDQDVAIFCPPPVGIPGLCPVGNFRIGNPKLKSEIVNAYESGLRLALSRTLSADLALFHNQYMKLRSTEPTPPFGAFDNHLKGNSDGAELAMNWQASESLQVRGSYSLLSLRAKPAANSGDTTTAGSINGSSPRHQLSTSLDYRFAPQWRLHSDARYLSRLSAQGVADRAELGMRLGWTPRPRLELALTAENLLHDQAAEFAANGTNPSELQRSAWLSMNWAWP